MKTYTFSEQGILKLRRRFIQRNGIILGGIFVFTVGVILRRAPIRDQWLIDAFVVLILSVSVLAIFVRSLKQQEEIWRSIKIDLGDDYIARQQIRVPAVRIRRDEIKSIQEDASVLCIYTSDKNRSLAIPLDLDTSDYREITSVISSWVTIQPKATSVWVKQAALSIVLLAGMLIILVHGRCGKC